MIKHIVQFVTGFIIIVTLVETALCAESAVLRVTFGIPAVPGLNAPLIEEKSFSKSPALTEEQNTGESQSGEPIQEEDNSTVITGQESKPITVQTIYSR